MRTVLTDRRRLAGLLVGLALLAAACGDDGDTGDEAAADGDRVTVVAGAHPLAEAVRAVAPDADVVDLTPRGAEPHDLELTPDQVEAVLDADLAVVMGAGFQPAVEEVAERRDGPTLVVTELPDMDVDDPHVWLDPTRMAVLAEAVADRLGTDAGPFVEELEALDRRYREGLEGCERRLVVATHAAYGHLIERYGLEQEALAGLEPEQEADPRRLAELVDIVRETGTTTIFTEPLLSDDLVETLAREAGVDTAELDPLESGEPGTYLEVMEENLAALRTALGCG